MTWRSCEREDVQMGDRIRLVVPEVLAIAESADDGRPAFGYAQGAVTIERWVDDVDVDEIGAALAGAGIGDLRRGIPLEDWKADAGPDGIRISGRLPDGMSLAGDLSQYSVVHPAAGNEPPLPIRERCPATDEFEGQCLYVPHAETVPHWFTMGKIGPFDIPEGIGS